MLLELREAGHKIDGCWYQFVFGTMMDGACGAYGGGERCAQGSGGET